MRNNRDYQMNTLKRSILYIVRGMVSEFKRLKISAVRGAVLVTCAASLLNVYGAAPTDITLSTTSINENNASNATVGSLSASDPDSGDTHTFQLVVGTGSADNNQFSISGNALRATGSFNYEVKNGYSIRIRATDAGGNTFEKAFTISVANVNEPPSIADQSFQLNENSPNGTTVGTLIATDPDGNALSYTIVGITNINAESVSVFSVNSTSGAITVNTSVPQTDLDFETNPNFVMEVKISDPAGLQDSALITINLNDLFSVTNKTFTVADNAPVNTVIGVIQPDEPKSGLTFSLTTGSTAFTMLNGGADLVLTNTTAANLSGTPSQTVNVNVTDGTTSVAVNVTINVTPSGSNVPGGSPVIMELPGSGGKVPVAGVAHGADGTVYVIGEDSTGGVIYIYPPALDSSSKLTISTNFNPKAIEVAGDWIFVGGQKEGKRWIYKISTVNPANSTGVELSAESGSIRDIAVRKDSGGDWFVYACGDVVSNGVRKPFWRRMDVNLASLRERIWGYSNTGVTGTATFPVFWFGYTVTVDIGVGGSFNSPAMAIAVDENGAVYVSGQWVDPGPILNTTHSALRFGFSIPVSQSGLTSVGGSSFRYGANPAGTRSGYIVKFDGSTGSDLKYIQDSPFETISYLHDLRVVTVTEGNTTGTFLYSLQQYRGKGQIGGEAFSTGFDFDPVPVDFPTHDDVKINRFNLELQPASPQNALIRSPQNVQATSFSFDADGNAYVSGMIKQGTTTFQDGGSTSGKNVSPAKDEFFVARLSPGFTWEWIRRFDKGNYSPHSSFVHWYPQGKKILVGGNINSGTLTLELGDNVNSVVTRGPQKTGFLALVSLEGEFVERLFLEVASEFGLPEHISPHKGIGVGILGDTYIVSVPDILYVRADGTYLPVNPSEFEIDTQAVTRFVNTGYTVADTAITGTSSSYTFVFTKSTKITFHWRVEHSLDIRSDLTGTGATESPIGSGKWTKNAAGLGLTSTAGGQPDPVVKKHWIGKDELVVAFINGIEDDFSQGGTRYRVTGYQALGAARTDGVSTSLAATPQTIPFQSIQPRQQIRQFVMAGPARITYSWKIQHRVQVSTTSSRSESLALVKVTDTSGQPPFVGTGEAWYDRGTALLIAARDDEGSSQQLLGWMSSSGQFLAPLSNPNGRDRLTSITNNLVVYLGSSISSLTEPARVLWNFGDKLYPERVTIGNAVTFGAPGFPGDLIKTSNDIRRKPDRVRVVSSPPGSTADDVQEWDEIDKVSYPTRPGIYLMEWDKPNSDEKVVVEVTAGFGGDKVYPNDLLSSDQFAAPLRHYKHLSHPDMPAVALDSDSNDSVSFVTVKFTESDGTVADKSFSAQEPGRHVLLFTKSTQTGIPAEGNRLREKIQVRVVETRKWDAQYDNSDPDRIIKGAWVNDGPGKKMVVEAVDPATIGQALGSPDYDSAGIQTGFIVHSNARYNANLYDRTAVENAGPIIPVNRHFTGNPEDDLVVVWYQRVDGILWPHQSVKYDTAWPETSGLTLVTDENGLPVEQPLDRIVIASRLGSEGRNFLNQNQQIFDLERFDQVRIYNQPDPTKAGYNPNEEHALIAPSFKFLDQANPPPAAYALRNDLNVLVQDATYTSEPYVLVEFFDRTLGEEGEFAMAVYRIEKEDDRPELNPYRFPEIDPDPADPNDQRDFPYTFNYPMKAGEPVQPPYPLGIVIGLTPCAETFGENVTTARVYWEDHRGQPWAVSAGQFRSFFSYPQLVTFWNGQGSAAVVPGTCLPFETTGDIMITGANSDPVFTTGSQLTLNGTLITINGNDFAAFSNAVDAANVGVKAIILESGRIRLQSETSSSITLIDGVGAPLSKAGISLSAKTPTEGVLYNVSWPENLPILKVGETLTYAGGEYRADHPAHPGLPGVIGWAAGRVIYDSANPTMDNELAFDQYTARLIAPLEDVSVEIAPATAAAEIEELIQPATGLTSVEGTIWYFNELSSSLGKRIYYDPLNDTLGLIGYVNDQTLGDSTLTAPPPPVYLLEPNILTPRERDTLLSLDGLSGNGAWMAAVNALYLSSRNPEGLSKATDPDADPYYVGLELDVVQENGSDKLLENGEPETLENTARPKKLLGPGLALVPSPSLLLPSADPDKTGYVTLVENDDEDVGGAITLHIVKVVKKHRYRGAIKTVLADNIFDEKITLGHTGDFGANGDDIVFQWFYREEDGTEAPLPADAAWRLFPDQSDNTIKGLGMNQITLEGTGGLLLADNLLFVRYRHKDDVPADGNNNSIDWNGTEWLRDGAPYRDPLERDEDGNLDSQNPVRFGGQWAGAANSPTVDLEYQPQLAIGWIKRVLDRINPYEARFNDFRNTDVPATYASMLLQAGRRFEGPVALNPDKNVIENVGLIELYQTVLERGINLSIGLSSPITTPGINNALMLAATRISDLYMLLGNEAYADAQDPTIGFGSDSAPFGTGAPSVFAFQNQLGSLMDEELGLLRGMPESFGRPVYNRLFWNFTKGEGEFAYALNYNISDQTFDGFIDESDAIILYPQGHGDAWGHYLTALKTHYRLLKQPYFNWTSRSERYNLLDVVIDVDFLDERKFARVAAAKAKAGAEIVDLTYRSRYVADPDGQWQGYTDADSDRAWGVEDWARRAGQGALFDWITANALIPANDAKNANIVNESLKKIDRTTVSALKAISTQLDKIQSTYDSANGGLNPLELANDVVPFDISPDQLDGGAFRKTHFEQIYERAEKAAANAVAVFEHANDYKATVRNQQLKADDFFGETWEQDRDYRNRLIEIFGTPYEGMIGTGKAYPAGYAGPDLMLFMYVDVQDITSQSVPAPGQTFTTFWSSFPQQVLGVENGQFKETFKRFFLNDYYTTAEDSPAVDPAKFASLTDVTLFDNSILELNMPITTKGYAFQAPSDWGRRGSPGELQAVLSEMLQAEADLALSLGDYDYLVAQIKDMAALLEAKHGLASETIRIKNSRYETYIALNVVLNALKITSAATLFSAEVTHNIAEATADGLPKTIGFSNDPSFAGRLVLTTYGALTQYLLRLTSLVTDQAANVIESSKELIELRDEIEIDKEGFEYEIREQLKELEQGLRNEGTTRIEVFRRLEALRQLSDRYRTVLTQGLALLDEREDFNKNTAGVIQMVRYQDMAFRNFRNDALQKYRASFDLAARYAYLAAKAYDYETNLDPADPRSARHVIEDIIRSRTLGHFENGSPTHATRGLAEALATLRDNYDVLKGQMGINNPQTESGRFSLRHELFRIATSSPNDTSWRQTLQNHRVEDLWEIPEFRRYCRPPVARSAGKQPGIVIPFSTQILFGENLFGWPLGGGDHAYDPSNFATKIRSVGVWFQNYDQSALAVAPRVYLVPAGIDVMTIPDSTELKTREWNVVDQSIPVPYPVGGADLTNPNWIPVFDTLAGPLAEIRRFSSFRAHGILGNSAPLDESELTFDTRLVGRSVWNTRWMLIIPGGTFHNDANLGLDTFIEDVQDIKLHFQTYGYSGN